MISYLANKKATGIVKKGHDKNFGLHPGNTIFVGWVVE